jgi:hypothetical protein
MIDGKYIVPAKWSPPGGDYDCTFYKYPKSKTFKFSSSRVAVKYALNGNSKDCHCDMVTKRCVSE